MDGEISIDDLPINKYDVKALREQIGYVMQEPILFNDTIRNNIAFGLPDATDEDIFKAAFRANAIEFIETIKEVKVGADVDNEKLFQSQKDKEPPTELKNETQTEKEERKKQDKAEVKKLLKKKHEQLSASLDAYLALLETIDKKLVLLSVFKYADETALELIGKDNEIMMEQIKELNQRTGLRWDDFIIRLEWKVLTKQLI